MKNLIKLPFVVLVSLFILSSKSFADDPLAAGKAALDRGDLQGAISAFREAVQKDKKNPQAYLWLGTALLKADSLEQAVVPLIQARDLDSTNPNIYNRLGDVYRAQNIPAAAIDQYKKAAALDTNNVDLYTKLAAVSRKARRYPDAVDAYIRVLALDSSNVVALRQLGEIYLRTKPKQFVKALPLFERLSKLQPDSLSIQIPYGRTLFETLHYEKFIPIGEGVLQRDASQTEFETMLAEAYIKTGKIDSAIKKYDKRNPDSLSIDDLLRYAKALRSKELFEKAADIYQKAYRRDSTRCSIYYEFGTLLMKVRRYGDAISVFKKKVACDTSSGYQFASELNMSMSMMQLKQFKEAKEHTLKAIEFRSDNIQAWQVLAQIYGQLEQTDDEITAYKKVIELATAAAENGDGSKYNPQLLEAYRMIGVRYLIEATKLQKDKKEAEAKKKYAASIEYLKKALQLDPKDCQMLLWLGQANQNISNKEDAKKYYCKLLQQCPSGKEAKDAQSGLDGIGMKCGQ
ncbi:MAG: tetratricopeptide repeat protein [Ignavibacteria bacterium]|nr:tetratricopeptide repeat protein [Ignavibacteria bacterium]